MVMDTQKQGLRLSFFSSARYDITDKGHTVMAAAARCTSCDLLRPADVFNCPRTNLNGQSVMCHCTTRAGSFGARCPQIELEQVVQ